MGRKRQYTITDAHIERWLASHQGTLDAKQRRLLTVAQRVVAGDSNAAIARDLGLTRERAGQLVRAFRHQAGCEDGSWAVVWSLVCLMAAGIAALVAWLLASGGTPWPVTALATGGTFVGIIIMVGVLIAWGA